VNRPNQNRRPGPMSRRGAGPSLRRRQVGAESLEFVATLLFFMTLMFLVIGMSALMFNKSVIEHAARVGARQGSLYWEDPSLYATTDPQASHKRVNESMIDSGVDYYLDNALIASTQPTLSVTGWHDVWDEDTGTLTLTSSTEVAPDSGVWDASALHRIEVELKYAEEDQSATLPLYSVIARIFGAEEALGNLLGILTSEATTQSRLELDL